MGEYWNFSNVLECTGIVLEFHKSISKVPKFGFGNSPIDTVTIPSSRSCIDCLGTFNKKGNHFSNNTNNGLEQNNKGIVLQYYI